MLKIHRFPPTPILWSNLRITAFKSDVSALRDSAQTLFWHLLKRTNRHFDQILILTPCVVTLVDRIQSHPRLYYWRYYSLFFFCYRHPFSTRFNNSFSAGTVENVEVRRLHVGDLSCVHETFPCRDVQSQRFSAHTSVRSGRRARS